MFIETLCKEVSRNAVLYVLVVFIARLGCPFSGLSNGRFFLLSELGEGRVVIYFHIFPC